MTRVLCGGCDDGRRSRNVGEVGSSRASIRGVYQLRFEWRRKYVSFCEGKKKKKHGRKVEPQAREHITFVYPELLNNKKRILLICKLWVYQEKRIWFSFLYRVDYCSGEKRYKDTSESGCCMYLIGDAESIILPFLKQFLINV